MPKGTYPALPLESIDPEFARETLYASVADGLNGCLEWLGSSAGGYGHANFHDPRTNRSRILFCHRVSWVLANEQSIPREGRICHTCDNPPCIAPDHLFLGTALDNTRDSIAKGRRRSRTLEIRAGRAVSRQTNVVAAQYAVSGVCRRGHPWVESNIIHFLVRGKHPGSACRACNRERAHGTHTKRRLAAAARA